jgi:hypothetical protein
MQKLDQHNEQGFAFILELVVVAMVLSAVGFGLYQYKNHTNVATKTPVTTLSTASDVNASLVKSAAIEESESASADSLADQLQAADAEGADAQGGLDESSF